MSEIAKILLVTLNRQFHVTRRTVPWLSLKLREGAGTVPSNWLGAVSTVTAGEVEWSKSHREAPVDLRHLIHCRPFAAKTTTSHCRRTLRGDR